MTAVLKRIAGVCGIISQLIGLAALLVTISRSPWFNWTENYISVLGVEGSAAMIFNWGLILTGALSLIFAIGLGKDILSSRWGQLGKASLMLGSIAFSAMGIFPRTTDTPHNCASLAFFVFITLAILLIGITAMTTSQKKWGVLSVIVVTLIVVFQLAPCPWDGGALPQLLSCLPWSLWTIIFGVRLLVRSSPIEV
ncbi:hypothetical protein ES703_85058 [subsurface metagenome]